MKKVFILFLRFNTALCFFDIKDIMSETLSRLPMNFSVAVKDIAEGLPTKALTVVRGNSTNIRSQEIFELLCLLSEHNIQVINLDLTKDNKDKYYSFLEKALDISEDRTSLILCEPYECENILTELTEDNLIHRTILYIFFWPHGSVSEKFLITMREAMRIAVITNPRESVLFESYFLMVEEIGTKIDQI